MTQSSTVRTLLAASAATMALAVSGTASGADVAHAGPTVGPHAADPAVRAAEDGRARKVVEKRVIGRSVEGRKIVAYRKGTPSATRTVVVLGPMHGDERAGVQTANHLIKRVAVSRKADVWVIPTMNPDGYAHDTRRNARGVDLNRNWPMNWTRTGRGITYSGPRAASEPETRAMMRFLRKVQPRFLSSIHQPYGEVGRYSDKPLGFQRRLARGLSLPLRGISVGPDEPAGDPDDSLQPGGHDNAPTLTGWYNAHYPGTAITVEYTRNPTHRYRTVKAGNAILRASRAR
ncbi:M14 family zinc carboxypeptidase [Nocardioides pantholopis]|uniref:M14 family zinc carboxypeptidase n=1 Tax=Nocardioides pantholopis TaxID=2483798 RepID=UPI000F081E78|nr:M14 family zinc carboxypeptidase [Nocardioides pantholopis]